MTPTSRQARIEALKQAIREGRYVTDARAIADGIIRRAKQRLASRPKAKW